MATAKNLKVCVTAGVGSDHIDLNAANEHKIGVYEVSGSNGESHSRLLETFVSSLAGQAPR